MAYTAVGFSAEHEGFCAYEGFCTSRDVTTDDPQSVADYLNKEFGLYFDQILLIKNGKNTPEVLKDWIINQDYHDR